MKSPFEALPIELIEYIVTFLKLHDIASLRLTSRTLENKASHGSFISFFKYKNIELTTRALKELVQITSQGLPGCLLQHCTITGLVGNDTRAEDEDTESLDLLTQAFQNLKQHSPKGGLASLCLRVTARVKAADGELIEPDNFYSWRAVWDGALRTFSVTMAALNKSQLPLKEHLDIFGSVKGCSLACDAFLTFTQNFASMSVFRSLKRLSVSLSVPQKNIPKHRYEYTKDELEELDALAAAETDIADQTSNDNPYLFLRRFMQVSRIMPELESLDLHWHTPDNRMLTSLIPTTRCEPSSATSPLLSLKECNLHGIFVSERDLLEFLEIVHPEIVTLTYISLISGKYTSIFTYLTSPGSPVTCYHLDDLLEGVSLVHFNVPGKPKYPYLQDKPGPSSLTRKASDVKETISYRFAYRRPLGSPEKMRWYCSKADEYGPPRLTRRYDFIKLNSQKVRVASEECT